MDIGRLFVVRNLLLATKLLFFNPSLIQSERKKTRSATPAVFKQGGLHAKDPENGDGRVLFILSWQIETEDIKQLQQLLAVETSGHELILDFRDVTLVNQDAVKFLCRGEADGVKLENCPRHVRRWIDQAKHQPRGRWV